MTVDAVQALEEANALYRRGEYEAATATYHRGLAAASVDDDAALLFGLYNGLGVSQQAAGDVGGAEPALRSALKHARTLGDELLVAGATNNLGYNSFLRGDTADAVALLTAAIRAFEALAPVSEAALECLDNYIAARLTAGGEVTEALELSTHGLSLAGQLGRGPQDEAPRRLNIGALRLQSDDAAGAVSDLVRAVALFESLGDREQAALVANLLGDAYQALGDLESATGAYERAIALGG